MDIKEYIKDTDYDSEENGQKYHNHFAPRGWNTLWWPQAKEMIFNCNDTERYDLILFIATSVGKALFSYDRALRHDTQSQCCTLLSHIAEHFSLDINPRIMEKVVEDGALEGFNNDNDVPKFLKDAYESLKKSAAEIEPQADELVKFFGADEFPLHVLPYNIQRIINEISTNKCASKEMIFMHLLALASSCVGSGRTLCPCAERQATWHEPAIFWGMIIADSGEAKSPTMKVVFKELRRAQIHEEKMYDEACINYAKEMEEWEKVEEHPLGDEPPQAPEKKQFYVDDSTIEAIHSILMHNPHGIMWLKDEIRSLLKNLNKYNNGDSIDVVLSMFSGFAWTKNRSSMKNRGPQASDSVPDALVGIYGGIQPGVFEEFFTKDDLFSGLAQRFLFCVPTKKIKKTLMTPAISEYTIDELRKITQQMLLLRTGDGKKLYLTPEAFKKFNEFYEIVGNSQPQSFLMKATNNTLRIALLLHLLAGQGDKDIDESEIDMAIVVMKWFLVTLLQRVLPLLEAPASKTEQLIQKEDEKKVFIEDFLKKNPEIKSATSTELMNKFKGKHPFRNSAGAPSVHILGTTLTVMGFSQSKIKGRVYDLTKRTTKPEQKMGMITKEGKVIMNYANAE